MNILVLLRPVQDPAGITVNRKAQRVFVNRPRHILNPSDRNALEAALQLGAHITLAACGGEPADQVLRDGRALGAAGALRLADAALAQADAWVLANVYRAVVAYLGAVDLVLCGAEVIDSDLAQVAPRLALALGWPFAGQAHQLAAGEEQLTAVLTREGSFRRGGLDLPAVVSVAPDSNRPRLPPGRNLINVYQDSAAVEVLTVADLGLDPAALTPLAEARGESFPPERELGKLVADAPALRVAELLRRI